MNPISKIIHFNQLAGNERIKRPFNHPLVETYFNLNCEEFEELAMAYDDNDIEETIDALCDMTVVAMGMIHALGYNPQEALDEVCNANLSKFCNTESEAKESVETYINDSRYTDVHYVEVNGKYVIKGKKVECPDGDYKILKGVNTRKPCFKHIIGE